MTWHEDACPTCSAPIQPERDLCDCPDPVCIRCCGRLHRDDVRAMPWEVA